MATMQARVAELSRRQIVEFFSDNAPTTQEQCDQAAERILSRRVRPAPVQGSTSYTVVPIDDGGEYVVQYRASDSSLDLDFLRYIEQTYGRFVPHHWDSGKLDKLHIYTMDNVGGVSVYLALDQLHGDHCYLLRQTLQDFARFVDTIPTFPPFPSDAEKTARLTLPTQLLRLGVAQHASIDAVPQPRGAVLRLLVATLAAFPGPSRSISPNARAPHLQSPEALCRRLAAGAQPH